MFEVGERVTIVDVKDRGGFPSMTAMMMRGESGEIVRVNTTGGFKYWVKLDNEIEEGSGIWAANDDELEQEDPGYCLSCNDVCEDYLQMK